MTADRMPWYFRAVVGIGAWVTGVVLTALGVAIVFALLDIEEPFVLAILGAVYLVFGLWLPRLPEAGVFAEQLGVASAAAGAALVAGGIAGGFESYWAGLVAATALLGLVILVSRDRTLQFLVAALMAGTFVVALADMRASFFVDLVALATPAGLALALLPVRRDVAPTAAVLLLTFPAVSVLMMDTGMVRFGDEGGTFAKGLHVVLFLGLAYLHWQHSADDDTRWQTMVFAVVATIVCLLLPAGGSAAMLLLMYAFVVGSKPFAALGALLQVQFIIRYYYLLDITLLDKSLLLMAVGALLIGAWWLIHRREPVSGAGS